ncbi:NUDIX hydrolase [Aureimonas sp. AU22]|uniref:NUDIX hydrolase n=1 Tax=Aureimonas sp. AU22 TaxID=1638162 RepID=UPI001FCCCA09|nr:NUDIX hydrolase [Aureimonas sp. AU22]
MDDDHRHCVMYVLEMTSQEAEDQRQRMRKERYSHQVAALPIRLNEERRVEVCLVTSRTTGRWIIPKGWPMKGLRDDEAAKVEAEEEAGLVGAMLKASLGAYTYWRRTRVDFRLTIVEVYALRVKRQKKRWKEQSQRKLIWAPVLDAADLVLEPELSSLLVGIPGNRRACAFIGRDEPIQF